MCVAPCDSLYHFGYCRAQRAAQGQHQQSHSSGVVVQLQAKLASMSNNFKQVLEVRTENLKSQKSRAEQFSVGGVSTSLPQAVTQGYHAGSVLAMEDDVKRLLTSPTAQLRVNCLVSAVATL